MDPASFFLMLIVAVVVVGGGIAFAAMRTLAAQRDQPSASADRPVHQPVTTPYHEHTDMTGAGHERDRSTPDNVEHQAE